MLTDAASAASLAYSVSLEHILRRTIPDRSQIPNPGVCRIWVSILCAAILFTEWLLGLTLLPIRSKKTPVLRRDKMFCLRSWLPLLFIPTNASPAFIFLFFICTYFLNRPCVYCSFLLLILFLTSCNWSDRCFFDFSSNWFQPRPGASWVYLPDTADWVGAKGEGATSSTVVNGTSDLNTTISMFVANMVNTTAGAYAGAVTEQVSRTKAEWTGLGMEWLRSLLGRREWRIDCLDVYIRL